MTQAGLSVSEQQRMTATLQKLAEICDSSERERSAPLFRSAVVRLLDAERDPLLVRLSRVCRQIDRRARKGWGLRLAMEVESAWFLAHTPRKTKAEQAEAGRRCSAAARSLAKLLRDEGLNWSALHFIPDGVGKQRILLGIATPPLLSDFLKDFAETAATFAETAATDWAMPRPRGKSAKRDAFVRRISKHLSSECGSPMYAATAALARGMFNDPLIDVGVVRNALRKRGG